MRIHNRRYSGRRPQALTRTPPQKQATTRRADEYFKKMNKKQYKELPVDFLRLMFLSNFFMPKASQYKMDSSIELGPRFPEIAPLQLHRTQLYFLYMLLFVFNLEHVNAGSSDFSSCPSGALLGPSEGQSVAYPPNPLHMLQPICPINNGGINPAGVNEADGFQQPEYRSDLRWLGTLVKDGRVKQLERLWDQGEVSASDFNELSRQSGLVPNLEKSVFVYAIGYQDYKLANFLFERGIYDPLYKDDKGNTELMYMLEVVKVEPKFERLLYPYIQKLDQKTINLRNDAGGTALIIAASYGQERVLAELLKLGADPNIRDNSGHTAIWNAVHYASPGIKDKVFDIVKQLVASQADLHLGTTSMGESLFFMAVQEGMDSPFLDYLLSKGFDIDARNSQGATPLMSVINLNSGNVLSQVNYLINRGANLDLQLYFEDDPLSPGGVSALILAVQKKMLNVVNELIKKGADLNLRDRNGRSALMFSLYERSDISELLLRTKVELDFQDSEGLSPLMVAVLNGRLEEAKAMLRLGARVDFKDNSGQTVLDYAKKFDHTSIVTIIIEKLRQNEESFKNNLKVGGGCLLAVVTGGRWLYDRGVKVNAVKQLNSYRERLSYGLTCYLKERVEFFGVDEYFDVKNDGNNVIIVEKDSVDDDRVVSFYFESKRYYCCIKNLKDSLAKTISFNSFHEWFKSVSDILDKSNFGPKMLEEVEVSISSTLKRAKEEVDFNFNRICQSLIKSSFNTRIDIICSRLEGIKYSLEKVQFHGIDKGIFDLGQCIYAVLNNIDPVQLNAFKTSFFDSDNSAKKKFKDYIDSFRVSLLSALRFDMDKFEKQQHIVEGFLYDVLSMDRYELTQLFQRKILSEDQQRICFEIDRYEHLINCNEPMKDAFLKLVQDGSSKCTLLLEKITELTTFEKKSGGFYPPISLLTVLQSCVSLSNPDIKELSTTLQEEYGLTGIDSRVSGLVTPQSEAGQTMFTRQSFYAMSSQFTSASCVQAKQVLEGVIHSIIKSMRSMEDGLDDAEISVLNYTHVAHFQFIIGKDTVDDDSVVDATIRSYRKKKGLPCDHSYFTTRGHNDFQKRYKKPIKDIFKVLVKRGLERLNIEFEKISLMKISLSDNQIDKIVDYYIKVINRASSKGSHFRCKLPVLVPFNFEIFSRNFVFDRYIALSVYRAMS